MSRRHVCPSIIEALHQFATICTRLLMMIQLLGLRKRSISSKRNMMVDNPITFILALVATIIIKLLVIIWKISSKDKGWKKVYKHMCTHDYSINPHPCPQCEQRFFRIAELNEHMAKHKISSSSVCSLCGQAFKCRRQMNKHHRRVHQKQNIYEHKRRRKGQASIPGHPGTEETTKTRKKSSKEYSCNACSRKCSSKLALQRHMGVHAGVTPFHCQHCEYKTRLKASLIQHMRIHTGEKPFKCETCSYASIDASSLRRHCRTHTSERPYTCHLCSYSCIQKKSLDLHVRRHHTGEAFSCRYCRYSSPDKQLLQKHIQKYHLAMESALTDEQPVSDSKPFDASD